MDSNSDVTNDLSEETVKSMDENKDNSVRSQTNEVNDNNKGINECTTHEKTTVVTDSNHSLEATSDHNIDTNCDNPDDNESNVQNIANDPKDNQMSVENNDSNLTSTDSNDSSDKFMAIDDDEDEVTIS